MTSTEPVYVEAIGRNPGEEYGHSHLYVETPGEFSGPPHYEGPDYLPMCQYGWNRGDGDSFSIFRGHSGSKGLCKLCQRRRDLGLPGVEAKPGSHKTKWL